MPYMIKKYPVNSQIDTICIHNNLIFTGSYKIENEIRSGSIEIYNLDFELKNYTYTSGTFDIKILNDFLYVALSNSVSKFNLNLDLIVLNSTPHLNTSIHITDKVYVTTSIGSIEAYDLNLNKLFNIIISNDILWSVTVYKNLLYCGGEDLSLYCIDLKNNNIIKKIKFEHGITCFFIEDGLYIGNYGDHIYKYNFDLTCCVKYFIGSSSWKIVKYNSQYFISCMYDGVKIFNDLFELCHKYEVGDLIYGIDVCDSGIFFAQFYEKIIFKLTKDKYT